MTVFEILENIEKLSGTNNKINYVSKFSKDENFRKFIDASLNSFRTYFIKKFDMPRSKEDSAFDISSFFLLLDSLEKREVTGNAAIAASQNVFKNMNSIEQKWCMRCLKRNLLVGLEVKSFNSCGFDVPVFEVMLATDAKKNKKIKDIVKMGVYASPKLDGYRCLAFIKGGDVELYSRNGNPYETFDDIKESLSKAFREETIILDGEVIGEGNTFREIQENAFAVKRGTATSKLNYNIFDIISFEEWDRKDFTRPAATRYNLLENTIAPLIHNFDNLKIIKHKMINKYEDAIEYEKECVNLGYEGAMIVPKNCPYYIGRKSNKLMKLKTMESMDCEVIGFNAGKGLFEGTLGGLIVKQENGETCSCGSGFSEKLRDLIYDQKNAYLGRIVEVKYQDLSEDGIMRFPIFMRFRDKAEHKGNKI